MSNKNIYYHIYHSYDLLVENLSPNIYLFIGITATVFDIQFLYPILRLLYQHKDVVIIEKSEGNALRWMLTKRSKGSLEKGNQSKASHFNHGRC